MRAEWTEALDRSKDMYQAMMDRLKQEQQQTLANVNQLKDMQIQAAVSAAGQLR